jgi:putative ABC transport system permease protein
MFRNWLAAALRNLGRNRIHAGISIFGLAFGITAALIAALVVRAEMSYDAYVPAPERTYIAALHTFFPGQILKLQTDTHHAMAALLKENLPQIEAISRMAPARVWLQREQVRTRETIYWSDPNIFDLLPLPVVSGDPRIALSRPDGLVITPEVARKYFGTERALGATLLVDDVPMQVAAIIEPPPAHRSLLESGIFASAHAAASPISKAERDPTQKLGEQTARSTVKTLFRLPSGTPLERFHKPLEVVFSKLFPSGVDAKQLFQLQPLRLDRLHLDADANPGALQRLWLITATGMLILLVACINFVNLATARASMRATEVGVRKALGASRSALLAQFLSEALLYVIFATLIAAMSAELLLPHVNAFLETGAAFDFFGDPAMLAWLVGGVLLLATAAGLYPAFVLSSFRPAAVLKGGAVHSRPARLARQILVVAQFAVLIAFIVAAVVMYEQRLFATSGGVRVATDQHYIMQGVPCDSPFAKEVPRLAGIHGVSCTGWAFIGNLGFYASRKKDGSYLTVNVSPVDSRSLPLYGIQPIAGRLFQDGETSRTRVVLNEAAVRQMAYGTPEQALGKPLPIQLGTDGYGEVIGVVKDFGIAMVDPTLPISPTIFAYQPEQFALFDIKLAGQSIPEALASIEALWKRTMPGTVPPGQFVDQIIEENYRAMRRQASLFGILSIVAVVLSCLGLIGLSAAATARRTREIGVRKAMGADRAQIIRLLLWQFSQPVLLAALIACPPAALLLSRWLAHYAYHIDLGPLPFLASTALTLSLALLTVSAHCFAVASERPISALRHE